MNKFWKSKKSFKKSNEQILEIKKSVQKSNGHILEIKKSFKKSNGQILEIKKIIREIKGTRQKSKTCNYFNDTPRTPYLSPQKSKCLYSVNEFCTCSFQFINVKCINIRIDSLYIINIIVALIHCQRFIISFWYICFSLEITYRVDHSTHSF